MYASLVSLPTTRAVASDDDDQAVDNSHAMP